MKPMTTNDHHDGHESEDLEEIISFESGQFAIVDAEVVKGLKNQIPLAAKAIFIPTKQSPENSGSFVVRAIYDDASLRKLVMEPSNASSVPHDHEPVEEGIQILGHEEDPVKKKLSRIGRKGGGAVPKTGDRDYRNKGDSAKGNQKNILSKGKSSAEARVDHAASIKGARRSNYGQPQTKIEKECMEFINRVKEGTISEDYVKSLEHKLDIRHALVDIRDKALVKGKSFDLVYEAVEILDDCWHNEARGWIDDLVQKGILDV